MSYSLIHSVSVEMLIKSFCLSLALHDNTSTVLSHVECEVLSISKFAPPCIRVICWVSSKSRTPSAVEKVRKFRGCHRRLVWSSIVFKSSSKSMIWEYNNIWKYRKVLNSFFFQAFLLLKEYCSIFFKSSREIYNPSKVQEVQNIECYLSRK